MSDDDPFAGECDATATGLMQCLKMLADEAGSLRLSRTQSALREALEICLCENGSAPGPDPRDAAFAADPDDRPRLLH